MHLFSYVSYVDKARFQGLKPGLKLSNCKKAVYERKLSNNTNNQILVIERKNFGAQFG